MTEKDHPEIIRHAQSSRSAFAIADYLSIEQLAIDLAVIPGAGIAGIEVFPITETEEHSDFKIGAN
jgi:hypothetical protein